MFPMTVAKLAEQSGLSVSLMRHSLDMTSKEYVQVDRGIKKRAHEEVFGTIRAKPSSKRKAK